MDTWVLPLVVTLLLFQVGRIDSYNITILHTNDIQARMEPFNDDLADCTADDLASRRCYGGMARLTSMMEYLRSDTSKNFLTLDAGDQFQGTLWFYAFGSSLISHVMNILRYDAMSPGNHEFDDGVNELVAFLQTATFPVLSCNMDTSDEPRLADIANFTTFNRRGQIVAVIGYTTPETADVSRPGNVRFQPEVESLRYVVEQLERSGVNKIIALGHSGYEMDKHIAENVPGIDVIVGGGSIDTFLYDGQPPSTEVPVGSYPTVLQSPRNETVLVVQAYAYAKYLGHLEVEFDDDSGLVTAWSGNPILLDSDVNEDAFMLQELRGYQRQLDHLQQQAVATSYVYLDGSPEKCRVEECNLGNLIADAMVRQHLHNLSDSWSSVGMAIINGGGIRDSIDTGVITIGEILNVLPFSESVDMVELTGRTILDTLEYCASKWFNGSSDLFAGFLQVSGMRITYDMHKPVNQRVADVQVLCTDCMIPEYMPIDTTRVYRVLMSSFLADGGDGYDVIRDNRGLRYSNRLILSDILLADIRLYNPVINGLEGRIRFLDPETNQTTSTSSTSSTNLTPQQGSNCPGSASALTLSFSLLCTLLAAAVIPSKISTL